MTDHPETRLYEVYFGTSKKKNPLFLLGPNKSFVFEFLTFLETKD